jgi:hypothetical protein
MPCRSFSFIRIGRYSGASDSGIELADRNAAWRELTSVCADMQRHFPQAQTKFPMGNGTPGRIQAAGFSNPPRGRVAGQDACG